MRTMMKVVLAGMLLAAGVAWAQEDLAPRTPEAPAPVEVEVSPFPALPVESGAPALPEPPAPEAAAPAAEAPAATAEKGVALIKLGAVDDALVERIRAFVASNLRVPVRLLAAQEVASASLEEAAKQAAALLGPDDAFVVALAGFGPEVTTHGVSLPDIRAAAVNVTALQPSDNDAETLGRRVERQVMQSIGMQVGMGPCPNPQCAMWVYTTEEELDAKGRNYCPPCQDRAEQGLTAQGFKVKSLSEMLMQK